MSIVDQLMPFMEPESVALIGVPRSTDTGVNTVEFMLEYGYKGRLYPVNPSADSIVGVKAYHSIKDVPETVDLAVISVPRQIVPGVVADCIDTGVKAILVVSQGFADADEEGKALQKRIVDLARQGGARIVGPNSMGTVNAGRKFSCAFVQMDSPQVNYPVGIASQSGLVINVGFLGSQVGGHRLLGKGFDLGNTCDVDLADTLEYFEADPDTKVIALHMEGIGDGRRFLEVAKRVSKKKPIIAIKAGRTEQGGRAVASHTGAMVGEDEVYQAAFDEAGIVRARDLEDLEDLVKAFLTLPVPKGNRVAMVTLVGAMGVMAVDTCADLGLEMVELSPQTLDLMRLSFPAWLPPSNPLDIWPASYAKPFREIYKEALVAVMEDPKVDSAVTVHWLPVLPRFEFFNATEDLKEVAEKHPDKPLVVFSYGALQRQGMVQLESGGRVASYHSVDRGLRAIAAMWRYGQYRQRETAEPRQLPVKRAAAQAIASMAARAGRPRLDAEGFDLLVAYGIEAPASRVAGGEDEAVAAATAVGFPVALKVLSPQISHKSDVGGVRLRVGTADEVRLAYREIIEAAGSKAPGAVVEGVLVQRMASGGQEVILGIKRDPQFGPVAVFGAGGLYAEVMKDVAFGICPLTRERAWAMVKSTSSHRVLQGLRETPKDVEAIVDALLRLSQMAMDLPEIKEMDINPLLAMEKGCLAVDVRVVIGH
ncbi:MAG: acetate--CoA ligase family protein [Dehalococcoidia bacterium]|nr:acetate--CoA ligase family protein [Dehalococcoidia bacterium]